MSSLLRMRGVSVAAGDSTGAIGAASSAAAGDSTGAISVTSSVVAVLCGLPADSKMLAITTMTIGSKIDGIVR